VFDEIIDCEILPLLEEYWIDDEKQKNAAAALFGR